MCYRYCVHVCSKYGRSSICFFYGHLLPAAYACLNLPAYYWPPTTARLILTAYYWPPRTGRLLLAA